MVLRKQGVPLNLKRFSKIGKKYKYTEKTKPERQGVGGVGGKKWTTKRIGSWMNGFVH